MEQSIFVKKKRTAMILITVFAFLYFGASWITNFRGPVALLAVPEGLIWLFRNFIPTENSIGYFPLIVEKLIQTVTISVAATMTASVFSLLVAVMGSRETGINGFTQLFAKALASLFRNMPLVAWSMILLMSFKQSEFTGFLALFFTTFGHLTRAFMETIDETSGGTIEAMTATGASYFQVIFQGVIPMVSTQLLSWLLYMIENNVRDATLVGILTGTGIGFLFDLYYKSFRYDAAGLVILVIVLVVIALELTSNKIRRAIL